MSTSQDARFNAIRLTVDSFLGQDQRIRTDVTRDDVATSVQALMAFGRTGRWITAVLTWKSMVQDDTTDLGWALIQGSVAATHAA